MIEGQRIIVSTSPTVLTIADDVYGHSLLVQNPIENLPTVYIGGPSVSSTEYGHAIASGSDLSLDLEVGEVVYACVATGTLTVNVLRRGRP